MPKNKMPRSAVKRNKTHTVRGAPNPWADILVMDITLAING